jgi:hypothetical protein
MANVIKHKRGTSNPSASDLVVGELAINTTDGGVFTETDGGTVVKIGRDVVDDTSPQLGGNLDVNGNDIVSTSNGDIELDPNGSGVVTFKGNATKGSGQFKLNCETNSHGIIVKGPAHSAAASYTLTLPTTDGSADQVLKTDGSGNLSWVDQASGGGGGGAFTYISTQTISSATSIVSFDLSSADYDHFVIYGAGVKFTAAQSNGFQAAINYSFYDGAYSSASPGTNRLSVRHIRWLIYESSYAASHSWSYNLGAMTNWSAGNPTSTVASIKAEIGGKTSSNISIITNFTDGSTRTSHSSIQSGNASNSSYNMNTMLIKCGQSTTFASGTFILYGVKNS